MLPLEVLANQMIYQYYSREKLVRSRLTLALVRREPKIPNESLKLEDSKVLWHVHTFRWHTAKRARALPSTKKIL